MAEDVDVSVVMSVYNGRAALPETLDSILSQERILLELIAINDGSTDGSEEVLRRYAERDMRVTVIGQQHEGLTRALINGCALARGRHIARQDVGDISLPGRLRTQVDRLATRSGAVFVSCGVRMVGPRGEFLFDVLPDESSAAAILRSLDPATLAGPAHHGSVLFLRTAYEKAGGYRPQFYFAQDLDLWVRLGEIGGHTVVPEIFYRADVGVDSISGRYRQEQLALTRMIVESARRRRAGLDDAGVLDQAAAIRPSRSACRSRIGRSRTMYFVGACLRQRGGQPAVKYFRQAIGENPLHLKAWFRLLMEAMRSWRDPRRSVDNSN